MEKVVITGTGAISALGHSTEENWENLLNGMPGIGLITGFDTTDFMTQTACEVKDFDPQSVMPAREVRRRDRYQHLAAAAVKEALDQSGYVLDEENSGRVGVIISSGIGGLGTVERNILDLNNVGPRKVNPFMIPMLMANGAAGLVGIDYGFKGPAFSVASACASGQDGIGMAWMMLRAGMIDVAITGASESTITPIGVASFDRIRASSRRGVDEPTPSPFDKDRDGLVMGEGAGILILETKSHAKARGAEILAELVGYASTADAFHITAPSEEGEGGARAMVEALKTAKINADQLGYINAHGTGTPLNDAAETKAVKAAFGQQAYKIPVSSTKSMTGHMMGATGAFEAVICTQVVRENKIPPTINYRTPDPDCDLDYVPNQAREQVVDVAMTNAFGFGGHNAVLVIKKYQG